MSSEDNRNQEIYKIAMLCGRVQLDQTKYILGVAVSEQSLGSSLLDVMHVEKNVFDNIMNTMMDTD